MKLSQVLAGPKAFRVPPPPSLNALASTCARIEARWPDVMPAPEKDREVIVREMAGRVRNGDWEGATVAAVVRAARLAFDRELRMPRGLQADLEELRQFCYRETRVSSRPAFVGAMFSIYLAAWAPDSGPTRALATALKRSGNLPSKWSALLKRAPDLLDPKVAARRLGQAMRSMDDPWAGLVELGFRDPQAPGLLLHAHLAYVAEVKPRLRERPQAERMLHWLKPPGREARIAGAAEAIDALLDPWRSGRPSEALRDLLVERLVAAFGDPRMRMAGPWGEVRPECRDVMLRWLTGADIGFFLDVVSQAEESHMWEPRRRFWWGLYEEGRIAAAWVAFCPLADTIAAGLRSEDGGPSVFHYGKQTASGTRSTTSLLIMQIGDCVVVEGSHSYKVQVFRRGDRRVPSLFKERYDCEEIRLTPGHEQQAHLGRWEERVLELIGPDRGTRTRRR